MAVETVLGRKSLKSSGGPLYTITSLLSHLPLPSSTTFPYHDPTCPPISVPLPYACTPHSIPPPSPRTMTHNVTKLYCDERQATSTDYFVSNRPEETAIKGAR